LGGGGELGLALGGNLHGLMQALLQVVGVLACLGQLLLQTVTAVACAGVVEVVEELLGLSVELLSGAVALAGVLRDGAVRAEENGTGRAKATENG
jgi:hypothetical protein